MLSFDIPTVQRYAHERKLEEWIHAYLLTGNWANRALSDGLKLQRRWWNGTLKMALDDLVRACGPEPHMEYRMDKESWRKRTTQIAESLADPLALPPLIIQYRDGALSIRDGNHRHEALRLKGWSMCWVLIWYDNEEDYLRHTLELERA